MTFVLSSSLYPFASACINWDIWNIESWHGKLDCFRIKWNTSLVVSTGKSRNTGQSLCHPQHGSHKIWRYEWIMDRWNHWPNEDEWSYGKYVAGDGNNIWQVVSVTELINQNNIEDLILKSHVIKTYWASNNGRKDIWSPTDDEYQGSLILRSLNRFHKIGNPKWFYHQITSKVYHSVNQWPHDCRSLQKVDTAEL